MRLVLRRVALYVVTAIVAITINFFLPRLLPGNPALAVLGKAQSAESPQAVAALEVQYGVRTRTEEWGQYVQYWDHLLHGNLGTSLNAYPASVGSLIRAALPWTLGLVGTATVIGFVLGNPYVSTSLGTELNMQSLTYEPLLEFNILNPAQPPIPWLATSYAWSDGSRRLTFTIRPGVKFSDGTPMTASDVAFTFNLLMKNKALGSPAPAPTPLPVSATAPDPSTTVLTFARPEYVNLFLIASTYVLPEHIWKNVSDPATYADADPVGTGPYELGSYNAQKVTFTRSPYYWQKTKVHVPEVIFPAYVSNTTANPALDSGEIGYAGNDVADIAGNYLGASTDNHTWTSGKPWFASNNVVTLWPNVTTAPLNDPQVRLAISAGIDRSQLSAQGETSYEPPATSSSGCCCRSRAPCSTPRSATTCPRPAPRARSARS